MGKREQEDSRKVLEGKPILNIKSFSLKEFLLSPYTKWKNKKRQEEIRKNLFWKQECEEEKEVKINKEPSADWIKDFLSDDEPKGE